MLILPIYAAIFSGISDNSINFNMNYSKNDEACITLSRHSSSGKVIVISEIYHPNSPSPNIEVLYKEVRLDSAFTEERRVAIRSSIPNEKFSRYMSIRYYRLGALLYFKKIENNNDGSTVIRFDECNGKKCRRSDGNYTDLVVKVFASPKCPSDFSYIEKS